MNATHKGAVEAQIRSSKGAAPEWMTYLVCVHVNHGETLYEVFLSDVQYQTMTRNVQVEPPCACGGEVWCAFTGLRADKLNTMCIPKGTT